jgi:putative hydrolase of the HAD superfamily
MPEKLHREAMEKAIARRPDAVLFDLWGTLIESAGFDPGKGHAAVLALCDNPRDVKVEEILAVGDRIVSTTQQREEDSALEFTQAALLTMIADAFGLRMRQSLADCEWAFWDAALNVRLIDGVADMLAALSASGMPLGVVSNSSFAGSVLERELARQGIRERFRFVISSADYIVRKPHPVIFEIALRRLGVEPDQAWFAGDNVTYDIEGAAGAGIFPVAFTPRAEIPAGIGAHAVITRWEQLIGLITAAR